MCRIDDVVGGTDDALPKLYAYMAASAAQAKAGGTTIFAGIFVDAVGMKESSERWDVVHSGSLDAAEMARYGKYFLPVSTMFRMAPSP